MQDNWNYTKHEEGAMDAVFLFSYAFGLYTSGYIGDIFDASIVHSFGLFGTGIIFIIFGSLIPYFNLHSESLFIFIWIINGLLQSLGWPTAVKLVANWFDSNHDGALFGIWASNQCIGNIIGAGYVSLVHIKKYKIQWMFYLPAIQAMIVAVFVFILVETNPPKIDNLQINEENANETEENGSMELVESYKKKRNNSPNKHNKQHYERIDDESLIKDDIEEKDGQHVIIPADDEYDDFDEENKQKISFWEISKLNNLITYSLCYACLKSVNYTMFFWLPYFETNHFDATDGDYLEISYS